jgi:hypothetical protein
MLEDYGESCHLKTSNNPQMKVVSLSAALNAVTRISGSENRMREVSVKTLYRKVCGGFSNMLLSPLS